MMRTSSFAMSLFTRYLIVVSSLCFAQPAMAAQDAPPQTSATAVKPVAMLWESAHAKHLLGLPETKPKLDGTLALSAKEIVFTTPNGHTSIDRARVVAVSVGGERMEKGGFMGKVARKVIPYGGGSALATVTQAQVDLLTVEFRDERDAYHGAVFMLPRNEAMRAQAIFGSVETMQAVETPRPVCTSGQERAATLKVSAISSSGVPVPAEYKALLYEQLMRRLHEDLAYEGIYRDGDGSPAAACPQLNLALALSAFNKGNAVLRASTGPLGFFVGTTSLKFHLNLTDASGKTVFDKDLKASQRGDNESLDIADDIAKTVRKKLKKQRKDAALASTHGVGAS